MIREHYRLDKRYDAQQHVTTQFAGGCGPVLEGTTPFRAQGSGSWVVRLMLEFKYRIAQELQLVSLECQQGFFVGCT